MQRNFFGLDGLIWAIGVVEDRFDPLMLGRCKVRYFGWHTKDKEEIPTEDLPWSRPMMPLDTGRNYVGPKEGDWVMAFFQDGVVAQEPIMIGMAPPGYPEELANPEEGYYDPRPDSLLEGHKVPRRPDKLQQYDDGSGNDIEELKKKERFPEERDLKEADTNRYERGYECGEIHKTVVPEKLANIDIGQRDVPTAEHTAGTGSDIGSGGSDWSEPETAYNSKYPYNHAYRSESEHLIEVDDTPGFERLHWYHRVGTFKEWSPVGGQVQKIVDKQYHIVLEQRFEHIEAADFLTVDWGKKVFVNKDREAGFNYDIFIGDKGHFNVETEGGKVNIHVRGDDMNIKVERKQNTEVDDDKNTTVHKNYNLKVDGDWNIEVDGNTNMTVHGDVNVQVDGDASAFVNGNINATTLSNMSTFVTGNMNATVLESCNANIQKDLIAHVAGNAYSNVEGDVRETVKGDHYKIVDGDYWEYIKGSRYIMVTEEHNTFCFGSILRESKAEMFDLSEDIMQMVSLEDMHLESFTFMSRAAPNIVDEAPGVIQHNAPITNASAILNGDLSAYAEGGSGAAAPTPGPAALSPVHPPDVTNVEWPFHTTEITTKVAAVPIPFIEHAVDIVIPVAISVASVATALDAAGITSSNPSNDNAAASGANDAAAEAANPGSTSGGAGGAGGGGGGAGGPKAPSGPPIGAPPGFLWKPVSESTGNLVVLLPPGTSGPVTITEPDGTTHSGQFSGNANGGRDHYRFSRPGGGYAPDSVVSFPGHDLTVPDGSLRYEQ